MSPGYAMGGIFSEKSEVFSFGVFAIRDCKQQEEHLLPL